MHRWWPLPFAAMYAVFAFDGFRPAVMAAAAFTAVLLACWPNWRPIRHVQAAAGIVAGLTRIVTIVQADPPNWGGATAWCVILFSQLQWTTVTAHMPRLARLADDRGR